VTSLGEPYVFSTGQPIDGSAATYWDAATVEFEDDSLHGSVEATLVDEETFNCSAVPCVPFLPTRTHRVPG
jgi:hypothetical protein